MEINNILPYFIQKCDNEKEFIKLQKKLFKLGYKWLNGQKVWDHQNFLSYPVYISNLSFTKDIQTIRKFKRLRKDFMEPNNNILFFDNNINSFDIKTLRKLKLKKLYEIRVRN